MLAFLCVAVFAVVCLAIGISYLHVVVNTTMHLVNARVWGHRTAGELAMAAFVVAVLGFSGHMFWTQVLHF